VGVGGVRVKVMFMEVGIEMDREFVGLKGEVGRKDEGAMEREDNVSVRKVSAGSEGKDAREREDNSSVREVSVD